MIKWIDVGSFNYARPKICNLYRFIGFNLYGGNTGFNYNTINTENDSIDIPATIPFRTIVDFFNHPTIHTLSEYLELTKEQHMITENMIEKAKNRIYDHCYEAGLDADFIAKAALQAAFAEMWLPISELKEKEHGDRFLGYDIDIGEYTFDYWQPTNSYVYAWNQQPCTPTHFQFLPNPPKEKETL